jgi:Uma2 family endonuclease
MATTSAGPHPPGSEDGIPPLETGDRLSRAEFERRYEAMPDLKKAELIEGVVYVPSPVRMHHHAEPHFDLISWLGHYEWATPGVIGADNASTRLDLENEPQPDAVLLIDPARGGQARVSADDYLEDAPELVAEVASSSVSYDLNAKFAVYRRNGVREYLVWRVWDRQVDWFVLRGRNYVRLRLDKTGLYRSKVFPGLWLDPAALVRGDTEALRAALQRGLASPEHAAFVARLNPPPQS